MARAAHTLGARVREPCHALAPPPTFDERTVRLADRRRTIRLAQFVLGLVGLIVAFRRAAGESRGQVLPDAPALAAARALALASAVLAAGAVTAPSAGRHAPPAR